MVADAVDVKPHTGGTEALLLDRVAWAAVNGIAEVTADLVVWKTVHTHASLLVGGEIDLDGTMLDSGVGKDSLDHTHDFGDTRLVIGTKQRRAVTGDQGLPLVLRQLRVLAGCDHQAIGQGNVPSLVALDDLRLDAVALHIAGSVHVCHQPDGRLALLALAGRYAADQHTMLVQFRILDPKVLQFSLQHPEQIPFDIGRGMFALLGGNLAALGIHLRITDKPLQYILCQRVTFHL